MGVLQGDWPTHAVCAKQRNRICICSMIALVCLVTLVMVCIELGSTAYIPWGNRPPNPDFPDGLEYGIRWFGKGNTRLAGIDQTPPNPGGPVFIFIHGWQSGSSAERQRESFNYKAVDSKYGMDINGADDWIDQGWNMGVFYWNNFADEDDVLDAEAKIWTNASRVGMRWRDPAGDGKGFSTSGSPAVTVPELFVQSYRKALTALVGDFPIFIAGHSLGSQVCGRAVGMLSDLFKAGELPVSMVPSQGILLDGFMSAGAKDYLNGGTIGGAILQAWTGSLDTLQDLVFFMLNVSPTNFGSAGNGMSADFKALMQKGVACNMKGTWISQFDLLGGINSHVSALYIFLESFHRATAPSAGAHAANMQAMVGTGLLVQTEGLYTFTSADDRFRTDPWDVAKNNELYPGAFDGVIGFAVMLVFLLCSCCICTVCCCRHRKYLKQAAVTRSFSVDRAYQAQSDDLDQL